METHRILIIDDNQDNLAISARLLKKAGHEVIIASNGLEGLRLAREGFPDLILLDILLPDISGYEVCRLIKNDPLTQDILVVYLTSINRSAELKAEGYRAGADGHIVRPISNNELLAIVEAYLRLSQRIKELRKSELRYSLLSEFSIEGVLIHDDKRVIDVNNTMLRMMGYGSIEEAKDVSSILDFVAPDSRQEAERRLREGYEGSYMINLKRKDGSVFPAEIHVRNINYNGINARVVCVRDITDKLMMERELRLALDKALEASRLKSQFVANVSHELRTPLNAIMLMNELLEKTTLAPEQKEYIELIKTSAETLLSLINDILDLSKIEAGKLMIEEIDFDLMLQLSEVVSMFRPQATQKGLDLYCHIDNNIPKVLKGDPTRIKQVLMNLLGNAVKFTNQGSVSVNVVIHSSDTNQDIYTLLFQVADTGKGISQEKQEAIFESFTQEDGSVSRRYGGTGLGLTISLNLVRLMGGTMWVDSEVGKGSTFYFTLPLKKGSLSLVERSLIKDRQDEDDIQLASLQKLKILLVEDNLINQMLTKRLLQIHGHNVRTVSNGIDALWALTEEGDFDLVLMDVHLPELDGIKTTKIIRGIENYQGIAVQNPNIPVVALTANAMKEDIQQCLDSGMNDYLTKPFKYADLMRVIYRNLLNRKDKGGIAEMDEHKGEAIGADNENLIDRAKALELLGGDEEMLDQVYDMFVGYVPDQIRELKDALSSNDLERLGRISHSLKSNAGTIGCERLRAEAYKMEMAAKVSDLEAFNSGFSEFQRLLDRVLVEIGKMKRA